MHRNRPVCGQLEDRTRPTCGQVEQRDAPFTDNTPTIEGQRLRGLIPYGVESRDMGGWREVIEPGALRNADMSELVATIDHAGVPLGRYPNTLSVEDGPNAFAWAVELAESRTDVREAVERGDVRAGSWRMIVRRDHWVGDVRHIDEIRELRDVCVAASNPAAYPAAAVEYRTDPPAGAAGQSRSAAAASAGSLRVQDRASAPPPRGLAEEFRAAGFPRPQGEAAIIEFRGEQFEDRAVTWTGSVDNINRDRRPAAADLGYDQRWLWPAFIRVPVEYGATSVDVPTQTARALATAANVVRAVDAVTAKPETGSTLTMVTTPLKQVATIQTNVPNVYLAQPTFNTVIENDLRLAINDGLDKLVLDYIAASGFQAPGTDPLVVSIRKAITTLWNAGYAPDTLALTPAAAEQLDLAVSGITGGTQDFVFSPGQFAPNIWNLNRRISKSLPATAVLDSSALGKLYASPVTLARFEADAGTTNRSNVRMELNSVFGGERQAAAVRIAAS
jgi:phage head maturation protease